MALRERIDTLAEETDGSLLSIIEIRNPDTGVGFIASWRAWIRRLDHLWLDHHIEIIIDISSPDERGMCDSEELVALQELEAELVESLDEQAVLFGHVMGNGKRSTRLQTTITGPTSERIDEWIKRNPEYEIDYTVASDPTWEGLRDVLGSLA